VRAQGLRGPGCGQPGEPAAVVDQRPPARADPDRADPGDDQDVVAGSQVADRDQQQPGDPAAWTAQADALAQYPADDRMDRPLLLLYRAQYLAAQGQADHAAQLAVGAIADLAPPWRVPLLTRQAQALGQDITAVSPQVGRRYAATLRATLAA
jgi:hypothetical protein